MTDWFVGLGWVQSIAFSATLISVILTAGRLVLSGMENRQERRLKEMEQKHEIDKSLLGGDDD